MNEPIEAELIRDVTPQGAMARYEAPANNLALSAVFDLETAKKRLVELKEFVEFYMKEGEDFGKIPGTPKPTLYKSGADKLCDIYGMADQYKITNRTEDWSKNLFDYEVECTLVSKRDGMLVATGLGSCNSFEGKYRYRESKRHCPNCNKETIIKGKAEYGGGWLCWNKPGKSDGCGAKFPDGDKSIESQTVGKVENDDIPTMKNTFLKMAKKRAKVDAVLSATRSSGLFTQDMEDMRQGEDHEEGSRQAQVEVAAKKVEQAGSAHKTVLLKELGNGYVALGGDGLNSVLITLTDNAKQELELVWTGAPNGWVMPMKSSFPMEDICKAVGVGMSYATAEVTQAPAPVAAQPQAVSDATQSLGHGKIQNVEEAKSKKGDVYMKVYQSGQKMQVFDNAQMNLADGSSIALFTLLKTAKGQDAIFKVNKKGEYLNIVGVTQLGRLRWDEAGQVIR
jgi:hypothetical protein